MTRETFIDLFWWILGLSITGAICYGVYLRTATLLYNRDDTDCNSLTYSVVRKTGDLKIATSVHQACMESKGH